MNGDVEVGEVGMAHGVQENIVWFDVTTEVAVKNEWSGARTIIFFTGE